MKELLTALFNGATPSVSLYQQCLTSMPAEERQTFRRKTYAIALSEWSELNSPYRLFLVRLIKSERQEFLDYLHDETILGQFLYDMEDLNLFLKVLGLLAKPSKNHITSYTKLSFSLLLSFNMNLKIKTLSDKIRYAKADTFDFVELMEKNDEME